MANIVIRFADTYFANNPVEGLDDARTGFFRTIKLRENSVNLRRANTTVGGVGFTFIDVDRFLTGMLSDNPNYFLNYPVSVWIGRDDQAFSELFRLPAAYITSVQHDSDKYTFNASDILFLLNKSVNEISASLDTDFGEDSTIVEVASRGDDDQGNPIPGTENFPSSGIINIGGEFISYTNKTNSTFETLNRRLFDSSATSARRGGEVLLVSRVRGNPMTVLLQLLVSRAGDGSQYDTLHHGLGIPEESLAVETFTSLRDEVFPGDIVELLVFQDEDFLRLLQSEILQLTNTRFIQDGDKVGINLLDETEPLNDGDFLVDDSIMSKYKGTKVDYSNIINRIRVEYDYSYGSTNHNKVRFFRNEESIKLFGESKEIVYQFRGVSDDGQVERMVQRYFGRFANPNPQLNIETNFQMFDALPGHSVLVESDIIPSRTGQLGFNNILEIIKKSVDVITGKIGLTLAFTSFTGARGVSRISPAVIIQSIRMDDRGFIFQVNDASFLKPGFIMRRFFRNVTRYGDTDDFYGVSPYYDPKQGGNPTYGGTQYNQNAVYGSLIYDSGDTFGGIFQTDGANHVIRTVDLNSNEITFVDTIHASPGQIFEFADYPDVVRPGQTARFAFVRNEGDTPTYVIG